MFFVSLFLCFFVCLLGFRARSKATQANTSKAKQPMTRAATPIGDADPDSSVACFCMARTPTIVSSCWAISRTIPQFWTKTRVDRAMSLIVLTSLALTTSLTYFSSSLLSFVQTGPHCPIYTTVTPMMAFSSVGQPRAWLVHLLNHM